MLFVIEAENDIKSEWQVGIRLLLNLVQYRQNNKSRFTNNVRNMQTICSINRFSAKIFKLSCPNKIYVFSGVVFNIISNKTLGMK